MNTNCLLACLFVLFAFGNLQAQISFEEIFPDMPDMTRVDFEGVVFGSSAFGDVNGDGTPDVLITGRAKGSNISNLYLRDGAGNFVLDENTPFVGVWQSSVAFSDIDGDGDLDLLITGFSSTGFFNGSIPLTKLYTNDGLGNFSEVPETAFQAVGASAIAFADVDGDGDPDVLIAGAGFTGTGSSTKLYLNDGSGNFSLVSNTPFAGVRRGSLVFGDLDGDGDQDVLISGTSENTPLTHLYFNDGAGNFSLANDTPFAGLGFGENAIADVDGDGDLDILTTGTSSSNAPTASMYINNGSGVFELKPGTPFIGAFESAAAFADVDGDGDQDVVISTIEHFPAMLYINDGNGNFTIKENSLKKVGKGTVDFADLDGDGYPELLLTGRNRGKHAKLYRNDGSGNFSQIYANGLAKSSVAFADIDGDGDQDVLVLGKSWFDRSRLQFYSNDGTGNFTKLEGQNIKAVDFSALDFADVDGDGDQDLLITGLSSTEQPIAKLYSNDGNGLFTEVIGTPFVPVHKGTVTFADMNGDGHQDVLITGKLGFNYIFCIYHNNGNGAFTLAFEIDNNWPLGSIGSVAVADVDGDADLDVLITAGFNINGKATKLFINNGSGFLTEAMNTPFAAVSQSSIVTADVDGDGDQDVFLTGIGLLDLRVSKLYLNDGNGNFEETFGTPFVGLSYSSSAFSDVDGDGDQDLLVAGLPSSNVLVTKLYVNDGSGVFEELEDMPFEGTYYGDIAFAEVNGDGKPDVLITGFSTFYGSNFEWLQFLQSRDKIARIYLNTTSSPGINTSGDPAEASLLSYPNPAESASVVIFRLMETGRASLDIYDISGRLVHSLFNATADAGVEYRFEFDGSHLPNGAYIYRLTTENEVLIDKFIMAR